VAVHRLGLVTGAGFDALMLQGDEERLVGGVNDATLDGDGSVEQYLALHVAGVLHG